MYHRYHFMKNILQYHFYILPISASFLLLRELLSIWHLDIHPNCLLSGLFYGGTYLKVLLVCLQKKAIQGHWIYVSPTGIYSLVVNWWGIVSWSKWCASLFSENQICIRILKCTCTVTFFGWVYTYLYFHIRIYFNSNSWFRRCCFFQRCTRLDREILNSIKKSVSTGVYYTGPRS